jgi:hypothetical protein
MKHAVRAVIAVALGAGLAAAAQAQSTNPQPSTAPATQMQSTAPSSTMQSTPPGSTMGSTMESTAPQKQQLHASVQKRGQKNIRQVQLRLKSEGLLRGKLTGKMDRQTRIALAREQENGLARSGSSMRPTRTAHLGKKQPIHTAHMTRHAPKSQTTGVGSSMPNTKNTAATTTTNPAPAGAGGTTSTAPSSTTTTATQPSASPAKK